MHMDLPERLKAFIKNTTDIFDQDIYWFRRELTNG